jgi:hypothetical protein
MTQPPQPSHTAGAVRSRARRLPRLGAVAILAAIGVGAAACSSSSTPNASNTTTSVTINPATAQTDIGTSYSTLFDLSNPDLAPKVAVIQNGTQIQTAMQQALSSSLASSASGSKIDSVNILSAAACHKVPLPSPCAHVVYDILGANGTAILPNSQGYAIYSNGQWLVAKATICGLLGLFEQAEGKSSTPPGC